MHHLTHHARKTGRKLDVVVDGLEGDERFDVTVEPYREEMMKELGLEKTIGNEMKATSDLKKEIEELKLKLNIKGTMIHIGKNKKEKKNYSENENNAIIKNNTYDIKLWDYFKKNIKNLA